MFFLGGEKYNFAFIMHLVAFFFKNVAVTFSYCTLWNNQKLHFIQVTVYLCFSLFFHATDIVAFNLCYIASVAEFYL